MAFLGGFADTILVMCAGLLKSTFMNIEWQLYGKTGRSLLREYAP